MTRILVVEDSEADRQLVGGLLRKREGCVITFANDGAEALEQIRAEPPELIVTDLRMPRVDGLELVRVVRAERPLVPVILMTAHGSEILAVEALKQGAAGYVPKAYLANKLQATVDEVLALAHADRNYERLIGTLSRSEFTFFLELENDVTLIDPLLELVKQSAASLRVCDFIEQLRLGVALREALENAILHGNLELSSEALKEAEQNAVDIAQRRRELAPYKDRRVFVDVRISCPEARIMVRDEGPGFDVTKVPSIADATIGETNTARGLSLMRTFLDEVHFSTAGNEVTLVKRRRRTKEPVV